MRFTALIAATMALAGSAAAQCPAGATANCKPGFNYCASTLNKLGDADSAIREALRVAGYSSIKVKNAGLWDDLVFHCNDDHTLKLENQCEFKSWCADGGVGHNDYCKKSELGGPFGR
ncbi:uncharacterized protein AKAW2_20068S [Aspergillus luchuensis]|uniref:Uncharacterized protein n=2 Tax=Aspergillus kawachii TaxID=1069201 RepID=A0A7R7WSD1_ASPKA|nr:uncharacterized protein AKAW2_20068S [Aspergillus luchuensis]BCR95128.1 hypothetical protein AKAW2_20068S [Aspergillus luchuensis]BCS07694.1 hypothetical protein ALUC_20064S [Aspergillus luchuensis]GAA89708.1 hypothetical protein AKAW_07822 [Aspergillus luchuensis IFO 4308]